MVQGFGNWSIADIQIEYYKVNMGGGKNEFNTRRSWNVCFSIKLPWIASAEEQVGKGSRIQGQGSCTTQDKVCIKCEDKRLSSPMSVNNFLKAVSESCYVVFVAFRVVNLYTFFHHRMSLLS